MKVELTEMDLLTIRRYGEVMSGPIDEVDGDELDALRRSIAVFMSAIVGAEDKWVKLNASQS